MQVVALSGGVGGARLVDGLAQILSPDDFSVVVNTGDDFTHWGLNISPDLDTVTYTLAGVSDAVRGWGLEDESFRALEMMKKLGGPGWFSLGDRDLATHLFRTEGLKNGMSLTAVTKRLCIALGVRPAVLPMSDGARPTFVDTTSHGKLKFQDWFVLERAIPPVRAIEFRGAPTPTTEVLSALREADLVVFGPSNPYVSIQPILALEGVLEVLREKSVIAVSPIVNGQAVKGPLRDMMIGFGVPASPAGIVRCYPELLTGIVVQSGDEEGVPIPVVGTQTIMKTRDDRKRLAHDVLSFAESMR